MQYPVVYYVGQWLSARSLGTISTEAGCKAYPVWIPVMYVQELPFNCHLKVALDLYSALSRTRLWCATASHKTALISTSQPVQLGTSTTLRDHGYGLVYHAICLFTLPAFARYSFQPATEGGLRLSRPGFAPRWFTCPDIVGHPPKYHPCTNRA